MPELVIIRGLPGAGKTTIAERDFPDHVHYEADHWFAKDGEYKFEPWNLKEAHGWCQAKAVLSLSEGKDVVVANTFTRIWEMRPYFIMASEHGAACRILTAKGDYGSIHDVPDWVLDNMKERWEHMEDGYVVAGNMVKQLEDCPLGYWD